jgi:SH3-like domain-containing protein
LLLPVSAWARMVSISATEVNLRTAPSTTSKVKWVLGRGFPLQVLHSKGKWLKVRDFENDSGWVYAPLTSSKGHMAVKKKIVNIRSGPGTKYRIVAQPKYGVVFRTITQRGIAATKPPGILTVSRHSGKICASRKDFRG